MTPFNKILKEALKKKNWSARNLARSCGMDSSYISKILRNKRNPPTDEKIIGKLAKALDLNAEYLIFAAGKIPARWQSFFARADISEFLENAFAEKPIPKEETEEKIKPRYYKPDLPDEIL